MKFQRLWRLSPSCAPLRRVCQVEGVAKADVHAFFDATPPDTIHVGFPTLFSPPFSTLASIASDLLEAWLRFQEQSAAYKEGSPPQDRRLELSDVEGVIAEFWALWAKVVNELDTKGIRAGPASFKGSNDGDAGFVRAIWCLVRCLQL